VTAHFVNVPTLVDIPIHSDPKGQLGVIESSRLAGFDFRRVYYLFGVPDGASRGAHAHKRLRQMIVCLHGSVRVELEYRDGKADFVLDEPTKALLVPPGCWRDLTDFRGDAVVAVLASDEFDESDYIRSYSQFQGWLRSGERYAVPYLPLAREAEFLGMALERSAVDVIRSGNYIGGAPVTAFEEAFAAYCNVDYAVSCANGLDALILGLEALGIGDGDEVIVPANSFAASALAITLVGARPILVDIDTDSYSIDPNAVLAALTSRTRAIMPVHLYGTPANMQEIDQIAETHRLFVVEDAAQAHGAEYNGRRVGSLGHVAGFSFYPTKNLGALGDGGCITTNDETLAKKLRLIANYGSSTKYRHEAIGRNSRLDAVHASMLSVKLRHLDRWNARRRELAQLYLDSLAELPFFGLPYIPPYAVPVWHVFPLRVERGLRDACVEYLRSRGIGTNIHYPIPIHKQPIYSDSHSIACKNAERIANELVSLPLSPFHSESEILQVADVLRSFARSK
jgi:dTDP-4-amino-4,6-dideoxygalactose transaminase